ncbi:hypothetical protein CBL_12867 [Carabus blaptoides fortunei]
MCYAETAWKLRRFSGFERIFLENHGLPRISAPSGVVKRISSSIQEYNINWTKSALIARAIQLLLRRQTKSHHMNSQLVVVILLFRQNRISIGGDEVCNLSTLVHRDSGAPELRGDVPGAGAPVKEGFSVIVKVIPGTFTGMFRVKLREGYSFSGSIVRQRVFFMPDADAAAALVASFISSGALGDNPESFR